MKTILAMMMKMGMVVMMMKMVVMMMMMMIFSTSHHAACHEGHDKTAAHACYVLDVLRSTPGLALTGLSSKARASGP